MIEKDDILYVDKINQFALRKRLFKAIIHFFTMNKIYYQTFKSIQINNSKKPK
jgi:hypothetical protein